MGAALRQHRSPRGIEGRTASKRNPQPLNKPRTRPAWRTVDGVLLLDKPPGISSNQALQKVRRLLGAAKAGHSGSLDPLATGMLPLCFGEATKFAGLLLGSAKAYAATAVLGSTTDTDDADGEVLRTHPVPPLADADIEAALVPLRGPIRQRPPIYSALKQGGEALYRKARRGESIEVPEREVEVHALRLLARNGDRLHLEVECGSGTYVRSLVRDLGEALGCGAHVAALRRLWVDPFQGQAMHTLAELEQRAAGGQEALDPLLLDAEQALPHLPRLVLDADASRRLCQGQGVHAPGASTGLALALGQDGPLGLVDVEGGLARPRRLFRT
jgi:tRNA pseudouridine55 synthase